MFIHSLFIYLASECDDGSSSLLSVFPVTSLCCCFIAEFSWGIFVTVILKYLSVLAIMQAMGNFIGDDVRNL